MIDKHAGAAMTLHANARRCPAFLLGSYGTEREARDTVACSPADSSRRRTALFVFNKRSSVVFIFVFSFYVSVVSNASSAELSCLSGDIACTI